MCVCVCVCRNPIGPDDCVCSALTCAFSCGNSRPRSHFKSCPRATRCKKHPISGFDSPFSLSRWRNLHLDSNFKKPHPLGLTSSWVHWKWFTRLRSCSAIDCSVVVMMPQCSVARFKGELRYFQTWACMFACLDACYIYYYWNKCSKKYFYIYIYLSSPWVKQHLIYYRSTVTVWSPGILMMWSIRKRFVCIFGRWFC